MLKIFNKVLITIFISIFLSSCNGKIPGADARKISPNPDERVRQNIEQGKGFRLSTQIGGKAGEFDFASSNELWRASLDTIEFMPLALANYSGGIIVTDWYSDGDTQDKESIKISIRFLSNEIRADALAIKIFYKNCSINETCRISDRSGDLSLELSKKILTKAAIYEKEKISKNKPYINEALGKN